MTPTLPTFPVRPVRQAAAAMVWLLAAAGAPVQAQTQATPPDAGRLLDESRQPTRPLQPPPATPSLVESPVRPPAQFPEGLSIEVSGFRISGARSFPDEVLAALVKPFTTPATGKRLDIRALNDAAGAITRHYQANGHLLTYAYLPEQRVADGQIEIAVLEGRLDGVQVVTAQDVRLRDAVVQAHTEPLTTPPAPVAPAAGATTATPPLLQADVERRLLLLNDIPGVIARGVFTPGAAPGAADMVVSVAEDDPLVWRVDADNHGSRSTGEFRAGFGLQVRDVFGWGEQFNGRAQFSAGGGLVNGSLAALVPLGGNGWKLGASLSHLTYALSGAFQNLGAAGKADSLGLEAGYAALRSADANLALRAAWEQRQLGDTLYGIGSTTRKRNRVLTFGLNGDRRDGWLGGGSTLLALTLTAGDLDLLQPGSAQTAEDQNVLNTLRRYRKLNGQLARVQSLGGPLSFYGRVLAQASGGNLDSSEKLALGGPYAVRAYAPGEVAVDRGALLTLELRWQMDSLGGGLTWSVFHDQGEGVINRLPLPTAAAGNEVRLIGTGVGLAWTRGDYALAASLAWRGSRSPTTDGGDPKPRLYLQLSTAP